MQMQTQARCVRGTAVAARVVAPRAARCSVVVKAAANARPKQVFEKDMRFRLDNIGPAPGSRRQEHRKGRGYGAGQVCTLATRRRCTLPRPAHACPSAERVQT